MKFVTLISVISFLSLSACHKGDSSSEPDSNPASDLASAKSKWQSSKGMFVSYDLKLDYSGMTGDFQIISSVSTNSNTVTACTQIYREWSSDSSTTSNCALSHGVTVDQLFSKIETAISNGQSVDISYDPEYGVPVEVSIRESSTPTVPDASSGFWTKTAFSGYVQ